MTTPPPEPTQAAHPRQRLLLIIAGVLLAAVVAIVLVITLRGGSDAPAPGSPDAVTDQLAAALQAHSRDQVAAVACPGDSGQLAAQTRAALAVNRSAQRAGTADAQGKVAVGRIMLALSGAASSDGPIPATVAMQQAKGSDWCVAAFAVALPTTTTR